MNKNLIFGILMVTAGAMSYGVLSTIVKLAYQHGFTAEEVTFAQYFIGVLTFGIYSGLQKKKSIKSPSSS